MPALPVLEEHLDPVSLAFASAFGAEPLAVCLGFGKMRPAEGASFTGANLPDGRCPLATHADILGEYKAKVRCGFFVAVEYPSAMPEIAKAETKDVRLNRPLGDDEFKAKLEMTKAFCDTAKSYVQISSAGLALPVLFTQMIVGKTRSEQGLGVIHWTLAGSWVLFLVSIGCGLVYQWLAMRRLWDQYHGGHRTLENMKEPGYRLTKGILQTGKMNLSWVWLGMTGGFFTGAICFVLYAAALLRR